MRAGWRRARRPQTSCVVARSAATECVASATRTRHKAFIPYHVTGTGKKTPWGAGSPGHTTVLKSQGQDTRAYRTQHTTSSSTQPHANSTVAACSCLPDAAPTSGGPGAVAITVTTTALDRVSGVVCGDACVPGFGCGLARESVGRVGLEVGLEVGSCASLVCAPPVSLNQTRVIKSHAPRQKSYLCRCLSLSRVTLWLPVFLNRYR